MSPELFLDFSRKKLLDQYWPRLRQCVEPLSDDQIWWRTNSASNSIGNLILHLNGNVRQWIVTSFNRLQDARNRPAEFSETGSISASALVSRLAETMQEAAAVSLGSPKPTCSPAMRFRAIRSAALMPYTRSSSTSACITGRYSISPRVYAAGIWAYIAN